MSSNFDQVCDYYNGRLESATDSADATCVSVPRKGACAMPGSVRVDATCRSTPMSYVSAACALQQNGTCVLEQAFDSDARLREARCHCPDAPRLRVVTNAPPTPNEGAASTATTRREASTNACEWLASRGDVVCGTASAPRSCADVGRMCQTLHGEDDALIARCVRAASSRISDAGLLSDASVSPADALDRCCTYFSPEACRIELEEGTQACEWMPDLQSASVHPSVECEGCDGSGACPLACTANDNPQMDASSCRRLHVTL